ncbi:hypothetical protein RHSIM_Rhsim06G0220100 [Rhododendron simsii]|uniref:Uncharacterized protein n=1 Tax=Rhododendron simsii TaxID=118357 RepID=A0A834LKY5_RHOSS|nr:hypothetical protein RHSIM_Rhsim06G0220100 [Rhododendron simsii]
MGVIHLPSRRDSRGWSRARIAKVSRRWYRARVGLRKVRGQRAKQCGGSSTQDREGPAGVVAREDREAPEYFSLEDLPESSGDELGIDRTTETVSRTESGAVPETGSSSPATALMSKSKIIVLLLVNIRIQQNNFDWVALRVLQLLLYVVWTLESSLTERLIAGGSGTKLDVEIPLEVGAPIGENATRFATWLGIQIRMAAPLKNVENSVFSNIPLVIPALLDIAYQSRTDKFNIVGYDEKEHVRRGVDRKCKKLYRTWRHNMKDHYEALVEAGKDPYVNPYKGVSGEDWAWMIGNIWTNKDKEVLVLKRKKARSKVPFKHTMGSQSFASAMAAQTHKRGSQRPHIADFYSSTHCNQKKKKWVAPICEQLHLLLEERQKEDEARCQEVDALGLPITMPQEEMPIEVLDKKFYVKEYGVSLKSSSSKRSSGQSHEEVRVLKNEVETLKDVCKQQND